MAASSTTPAPGTNALDDAETFFTNFVDPYVHKIAPGVTAYWLGDQACIDGGNIALTPDQAAHLAAVLLRH